MSDFLDLVLARSYDAITGAVRPRPVARFELPDHVPPATETPTDAALAALAPAAAPAATPPAAPAPPAPPLVARERITTRELQTIRETTIRPAIATTEPPAPPAPAERRQALGITIKPSNSPKPERGEPVTPAEAQARATAPAPPAAPQPIALPIAPLMPQPQAEPTPAARPIAPVVQVRIGRVELHGPAPAASPPRPPAPRSAPAPVRPVRSLDDYLRRRNEER